MDLADPPCDRHMTFTKVPLKRHVPFTTDVYASPGIYHRSQPI